VGNACRFLGLFSIGLLSFLLVVPTVAAQQRTVTVTLAAQNDSNIAGTVTLTDLGNSQTRVEIRITPTDGDHPAHIHMGTCADLDPEPEFPLTDVQNGTSTTVVNASLGTLQRLPRAINLHLSPTDLPTFVACGNIPVVGTQAPGGPAPTTATDVTTETTTDAVASPQPVAVSPASVAPAQIPTPSALPRTGSLPDPTPILSATGLLLVAAGLGLRRRLERSTNH